MIAEKHSPVSLVFVVRYHVSSDLVKCKHPIKKNC